MKTHELIKKLQGYPPEATVYLIPLSDDSGLQDEELRPAQVGEGTLQKGRLGGPSGPCVIISYGSPDQSNLN